LAVQGLCDPKSIPLAIPAAVGLPAFFSKNGIEGAATALKGGKHYGLPFEGTTIFRVVLLAALVGFRQKRSLA